MPSIAYFVSSHGFGHAARAVSVIAELQKTLPGVDVHLYTSVPGWFFSDSLQCELAQTEVEKDIGLIQADPFHEDLPATIAALRRQVPFSDALLDTTARHLDGKDLVICDIMPLGIAAARRAGVPSILVENFTWDFIYRGYGERHPEILPLADALAEVFAQADHHVQTQPVCVSCLGGTQSSATRVPPISRPPRQTRAEVRERLAVPDGDPMILVTMGGIEWQADTLASASDGEWLVVPGGGDHRRDGHLVRLPHRSEFYHPDLIEAADLVVGKLGYSTVAEVHAAGLPFAYLTRHPFPESPHLEAFVRRELHSHRLTLDELQGGGWLEAVRPLLGERRPRRSKDGAAEVAEIVAGLLR